MPTDTADHLATMDRAARESGCGVPWHLLAAISRVESDFGRNMATSSAGAIGYGQFLPSSWQAYGSDGNAYDYRDALPAIASYLCQAGLARDPRAALFAYNHADWYVDLVLDLAVRYDRMAPGAPTPNVLDVGPTTDAIRPMHYASGRDLRVQTRARTLEGQANWLGIPWRGRAPGEAISESSLETTALGMLRAGFGLAGDTPAADAANPDALARFSNRAWGAGLLPLPTDSSGQWTVAEVRDHLTHHQPVLALVASRSLPGHPPTDPAADQPVVVIGESPNGLIYNDPSFSSSLGYGLEIGDADFMEAWRAAAGKPLQGLAFTLRPRPLAREAHVRQAAFPAVVARLLPTPTLTPQPPTLEAVLLPTPETIAIAVLNEPLATPAPVGDVSSPAASTVDYGWFVGGAVALGCLAAGVVLATLRRRSTRGVT